MTPSERSSWNGHVYTLTWQAGATVPENTSFIQASGVCFTSEGELVLVEDETGERMLPGGHPEMGESLEQTLIREVWEEACATVEKAIYFGSQQVDEEGYETRYQARFWTRVKLEPFIPRFETTRRILVKPADFLTTLNWSTTQIARAMFAAATEIETREKHLAGIK